jgi:hypothetical protein
MTTETLKTYIYTIGEGKPGPVDSSRRGTSPPTSGKRKHHHRSTPLALSTGLCLRLAGGACYEMEWAAWRMTKARSEVWVGRVTDGGAERAV